MLIGATQVGSTWRGRGGNLGLLGDPSPAARPTGATCRPQPPQCPEQAVGEGGSLCSLVLLCFSLPTPDGNLEQAAAAETPRYIFQA